MLAKALDMPTTARALRDDPPPRDNEAQAALPGLEKEAQTLHPPSEKRIANVATWPRLLIPEITLLTVGLFGPPVVTAASAVLAGIVACWWTIQTVANFLGPNYR
jgi:hypothetical protein